MKTLIIALLMMGSVHADMITIKCEPCVYPTLNKDGNLAGNYFTNYSFNVYANFPTNKSGVYKFWQSSDNVHWDVVNTYVYGKCRTNWLSNTNYLSLHNGILIGLKSVTSVRKDGIANGEHLLLNQFNPSNIKYMFGGWDAVGNPIYTDLSKWNNGSNMQQFYMMEVIWEEDGFN